jgi:hypothetical protein
MLENVTIIIGYCDSHVTVFPFLNECKKRL